MLAFVLLTPIGCSSSPDHGDGLSTDETTGSGDPANACENAEACVFDCGNDETCALECAANLGGEAGAALEALINCAIPAGCGLDEACLETSCGDELGAYDALCGTPPGGDEEAGGDGDSDGVDGNPMCETVLDGCVFECGSDDACALECAASLDGEIGAALEDLVNCMSSAGCGFNEACLDASCTNEFVAFDELCV